MTLTLVAPHPVPRPITEIEFCVWVGQALPGDRIEYHRGFLALDREDSRSGHPDAAQLRRLADRARWAAEAGLVHLVQRRLGPDRFAYLAISRRKKVGDGCSLELDPCNAA
jgi:hypothetical protein